MKLNQKEIFDIITDLRSKLQSTVGLGIPYPSINEVCDEISKQMCILPDQTFKDIVAYQLKRYKTLSSKKHVGHKGDTTKTVLDSDIFTSCRPPPPTKKRKSLDEVKSRKQLSRRTKEIFDNVKEFADEEGVEVTSILGLLLTFCSSKEVSELGEKLWNKTATQYKIQVPLSTALAIYCDSGLGRGTYSNQRKMLSSAGFKILPPWIRLREEIARITPPVHNLPEPFVGVYYSLAASVEKTVCRILQLVPDSLNNVTDDHLKLSVKFGFDGSGSHAIYHQANTELTNNIIMTMFSPLKLETGNGNIVWEQLSPNSPLTQRLLCLQMGKESSESLQTQRVFNDDITLLQNQGVVCNFNNTPLCVTGEIKGYMMDRKAANLYTGLGGSYCDLCTYSKEDCLDQTLVVEGFTITRDIEDIQAIFEELVQDDGTVEKHKNDYATRQGVTTEPIATNSVVSQQVLHALLRTFDHFMKTVVHLKAGVLDWSESPSSINKGFLKVAKEELQKRIHTEVHGTNWDVPDSSGKGGTTTDGNMARDLLHNKLHREIIISELPEHDREKMRYFGQSLSVILRVLSSKKNVNSAEFRNLCTELYLFLLRNFPRISNRHLPGPWISITPTLHKVLGHSWELIEFNDGEGLGSLDESGLEGCNKILRKIRTTLSRKNSQNSNLVDTLARIWAGSDPLVNQERIKVKPYCKHCKVYGHSIRYCREKHAEDSTLSYEDHLFELLTYTDCD